MPANIQGNSFLSTVWKSGVIRTERGIKYRNLLLKFDAYNNQLVFQLNDSIFRFTEPVKEFILHTTSEEKTVGEKFIKSSLLHSLLPGDFVQMLATGKLKMYRHYKKIVVALAAYNAVSTKQFEDNISYYIVRDNILWPFILNKKKAEEMFKDKWVEVAAYMEQNKLSLKNETGLVAAVTFYNSL